MPFQFEDGDSSPHLTHKLPSKKHVVNNGFDSDTLYKQSPMLKQELSLVYSLDGAGNTNNENDDDDHEGRNSK